MRNKKELWAAKIRVKGVASKKFTTGKVICTSVYIVYSPEQLYPAFHTYPGIVYSNYQKRRLKSKTLINKI